MPHSLWETKDHERNSPRMNETNAVVKDAASTVANPATSKINAPRNVPNKITLTSDLDPQLIVLLY